MFHLPNLDVSVAKAATHEKPESSFDDRTLKQIWRFALPAIYRTAVGGLSMEVFVLEASQFPLNQLRYFVCLH